jgi:transposase-like protein
MAFEPISKSTVHDLARKVSTIKIAREPRYRRCIAIDETKLHVKKSYVYVWSAVDVDSKELLALEASYGRSSLTPYHSDSVQISIFAHLPVLAA